MIGRISQTVAEELDKSLYKLVEICGNRKSAVHIAQRIARTGIAARISSKPETGLGIIYYVWRWR